MPLRSFKFQSQRFSSSSEASGSSTTSEEEINRLVAELAKEIRKALESIAHEKEVDGLLGDLTADIKKGMNQQWVEKIETFLDERPTHL